MKRYSPYIFLSACINYAFEDNEAFRAAEKYRIRELNQRKCYFEQYQITTRCIRAGINNKYS